MSLSIKISESPPALTLCQALPPGLHMTCPLSPHLQSPSSLSHVDSCLRGHMARTSRPLLQRAVEPTELGWRKELWREGGWFSCKHVCDFPASVSSDSDTSQNKHRGKGGTNETLDSLTLFPPELFGICLLYICTFHVTLKTDSIHTKIKQVGITEEDDPQIPSSPSLLE